ncbi:MAG: hypothetical protein AB7O88_09140 [Reyranellaceae bacterium]
MIAGADVIRRRNLIVATLIGAAIIAVALGGVGGVVWLLAG